MISYCYIDKFFYFHSLCILKKNKKLRLKSLSSDTVTVMSKEGCDVLILTLYFNRSLLELYCRESNHYFLVV